MSKGFGRRQITLLTSVAELAEEEGRESLFYVRTIVEKAYHLSPDLQRHERARAKAGDDFVSDLQFINKGKGG